MTLGIWNGPGAYSILREHAIYVCMYCDKYVPAPFNQSYVILWTLIIMPMMLFLIVTLFVQAGANINSACGPRGEGRTPLHIAAEHGHMVNAQVIHILQEHLLQAYRGAG